MTTLHFMIIIDHGSLERVIKISALTLPVDNKMGIRIQVCLPSKFMLLTFHLLPPNFIKDTPIFSPIHTFTTSAYSQSSCKDPGAEAEQTLITLLTS